MRKKVLTLGMAGLMVASVGLSGCSNNKEVVTTTTETVYVGETTVGDETVSEVVDVAVDTEVTGVDESESTMQDSNYVEVNAVITAINESSIEMTFEDGTEVVADMPDAVYLGFSVGDAVVVDYDGVMTKSVPAQITNLISIVSADASDSEEIYQSVAMQAVITSVYDDSIVVDMGGTDAVLTISDFTYVEDGLESGDTVEITFDGKMTRSVPAELPTVYRVEKPVDGTLQETATFEDTATTSYTDVEVESDSIITTEGTITEINDDNIHFTNEAGVEIIANISDITYVEDGLQVGDNIKLEHSDVMTLSEPGIITEVFTIRLAE